MNNVDRGMWFYPQVAPGGPTVSSKLLAELPSLSDVGPTHITWGALDVPNWVGDLSYAVWRDLYQRKS